MSDGEHVGPSRAEPYELQRHIGVLGEENGGVALTAQDRRMLEGFEFRLHASSPLRLGEILPNDSPDFSHSVHDFATNAVNARLDRVEKLQVQEPPLDATDEEIAAWRSSQKLQKIRHGSGRSVQIPSRDPEKPAPRIIKTFPHDLIDRYIDHFYARYGFDRLATDEVVARNYRRAIRTNQEVIFPNGLYLPPELQRYDAAPTRLDFQAAPYAQIVIVTRLRNMFRTLGLDIEADASDVTLAAYGQRLGGLSYVVREAGVRAVGGAAESGTRHVS